MTDPMSHLSDTIRAEVEAERLYANANAALNALEEKMSSAWNDLECARMQTRLAMEVVRDELRLVIS